MKRRWQLLLMVMVLILLILAWIGWQAGGMSLLLPGVAWC